MIVFKMSKIKMEGIFKKGFGLVGKIVMQDETISIQAKGLYSYICSYAGSSETAWPGRDLVCKHMNLNKDTFTKYLKELKEADYIRVSKKRVAGKYVGNVYTIVLEPCPKKTDRVGIPENKGKLPCPKKSDKIQPDMVQPDTNNNSNKNNSIKNNNNIGKNVFVSSETKNKNIASHGDILEQNVSTKLPAEKRGPGRENAVVSEDYEANLADLLNIGVFEKDAKKFAVSFSRSHIQKVIAYASSNSKSNPGGYVSGALRENWPIPDVEGKVKRKIFRASDMPKPTEFTSEQKATMKKQSAETKNMLREKGSKRLKRNKKS